MWLSNNKTKALIILFVYWLVMNYLVLHGPVNFFQGLDSDVINDVQFVVSDVSFLEELSNHKWQQLTLPDDWSKNQKGAEQVWYRAEIELSELFQGVWAVYLPSVSHNAEVFINGVWIGQGGAFNDPVSRHHNEPLLFDFSPQLLRKGLNQVDIRVVTAFQQQGFLGGFYLSPKELLNSAFLFKYFVRIELIKWITTFMYAMGIIVFAFWLARPQDSIYAVFSLEMFFWATHNLNLFVSDIPFSAKMWEAMTLITFGWMIITMIFFNHRYVGRINHKVEKVMLVFAISGFGLFLLPDISSILFVGYKIWDSVLVLFGTYALYYLVTAFWYKHQLDVFLMMLVGVPILVLGLHDYLMLNNLGDPIDGLVMQYSVIPTVLLFSWFLLRRFVKSINEAETLAANLEHRVEVKRLELQTQYEKLGFLEKQSVLAEERERIMRDMHDGIGGQLVSVITLLQQQKGKVFIKIREKVQHSLTDLRFVIDSLDPIQNELPTLLGMMRLRLHDQLESARIDLEWAVTDLPDIPGMSPGQSLHIMRIVQEAITNCIKHAECKKITLATGMLNEDEIFIDIIDYGIGMKIDNETTSSHGRGITNMHYRAQQIGASLHMDSGSQGTQIRLLLSLA
jgi:signal transduction histidine kinase